MVIESKPTWNGAAFTPLWTSKKKTRGNWRNVRNMKSEGQRKLNNWSTKIDIFQASPSNEHIADSSFEHNMLRFYFSLLSHALCSSFTELLYACLLSLALKKKQQPGAINGPLNNSHAAYNTIYDSQRITRSHSHRAFIHIKHTKTMAMVFGVFGCYHKWAKS